MTDFDTRLRTRLERLDAAIPAPRPPSVSPLRTTGPRRGRQFVVLLAATAALLVSMSLVTSGTQPPEDPVQQAKNLALEEFVDRQLKPLFPDGECVTRDEAVRRLRAGLDALGLSDWGISTGSGTLDGARCVTFGASPDMKAIVLLGAMDLDARKAVKAMEGVADELMRRCLGEDEARNLVSSALDNLGVTGWSIRTNGPLGPPQVAPIGREEAVRSHIANGCFVYSGAQRDPDGSTVYYISGP